MFGWVDLQMHGFKAAWHGIINPFVAFLEFGRGNRIMNLMYFGWINRFGSF